LALIIAAGIADAAPLDHARLSFAQQLHLAKAVAGRFFPTDVYEAIRRVNTIRNKLAHQVEPSSLDDLIEGCLAWCAEQPRFHRAIAASTTGELHRVLRASWATLTGVRDAVRVVREHMPRPYDSGEGI
jgi:hypothetical protein